MKTLGQLLSALLLAAGAAAFAAPAFAQVPPPGGVPAPGGAPRGGEAPRGEPNRGHDERGGFRDRDPRHFTEHDWGVWRGGGWNHAFHDGRLGWWWVVGPYWYFYGSPVYPYPDPYVPPAVAVQPAPPASGPPPAQSWYYCDNPAGYYPYVSSCPTQWRQVPATPQGAPQ